MFIRFNTTPFFVQLRYALGEVISPTQMRAVYLLLKECDEHGIVDINQVAYVLGTCWHECRFKSIREIRAKKGTQVWKWQNAYWPSGYYGRGYSQLTWRKNYSKFSAIVGKNLVKHPDLALLPEIGAKILVNGMVNGSFSGVGLKKYFPAIGPPDWLGARKIVNGTYQADKVAANALKILSVMVGFDLPVT